MKAFFRGKWGFEIRPLGIVMVIFCLYKTDGSLGWDLAIVGWLMLAFDVKTPWDITTKNNEAKNEL